MRVQSISQEDAAVMENSSARVVCFDSPKNVAQVQFPQSVLRGACVKKQ
jgi:hypothetical protein